MTTKFAQLIPLSSLAVSFIAFWSLIYFFEIHDKRSRKKNPLTSDLLRGPGEALREKISDLRLDFFSYMILLFLMPMMVFSMHMAQELYGKDPSDFLNLIHISTAGGLIGFLLFKLFKLRKEIHRYRLGLDAEIAIGQELNQLMREGYWVYHDFPAENFNIDHVVIGPNGVFAVETKGRPKPINADGSSECEVNYYGDTLVFPSWKERKPIQQAESQAKWLQKWISNAVGEPVAVHPVLALPGWYVKRKKSGGIPVINGKNPSALFLKYGRENLSAKLQQQIVHNIDQRCRTVLPGAYKQQ